MGLLGIGCAVVLAVMPLAPAQHRVPVPMPSGDVRVRVVLANVDPHSDWRTRRPAIVVSVYLRALAAGGRSFSAVSWSTCGVGVDHWLERVEHEGRPALETVFRDVPAGDYELVGLTQGLLVPSHVPVSPGDEVELVLHDPAPEHGAGFRVTLPADHRGEPPIFWLYPVRRGRPLALAAHAPFQQASWIAAAELPPPGDRVEWCLFSPGFERGYGDRDAFIGPGPVAWADVQLRRGWSIRLRARDASGAPLSAVGVLLDGRCVARTDDAGLALLRAPVQPRDPRLAFVGWSVIDGDVARDGSFVQRFAEVLVTLAPQAR